MKLLASCVLSVCVAGALASSILLPLAGKAVGKQISGAGKAASQSRDVAQELNKAQNSVAGNKNFGLDNQFKNDRSSQSAAARQAAAADYAQKSANRDVAASDAAQSGQKASSAATSQQASRNNAASQSAVQDNLWSAQRNFKNGNRRGDNIDYAYDKKFDLNDNQNGAYVYVQDSNAKAQDNFYDRNSAYDRNVDNFAASASAADKQSNDRSSQARQSNAANQAARDKFGRDSANGNQLWANQKAYNNKLDSTNQANQQASFGKKYASGLNQGNYQRDNGFQRSDAAAKKLGYATGYPSVQGAALSPYYAGANYYGPGSDYGPSSYFPKTGPGIGKAVGAQDYAKAYDLGSSNQLQNRGDYNLQDYSLNGLNKNLWANDQFQSADNSQSASSRDQGFSDKANGAAQNADRYGRDWAAATAAKNQDQKAYNFDEDAKFQESAKKVSSDRDRNNRVYQKYFNNDNKNGNNWERLKYNRDQDDDVHGFDNQQRREKAFRDVKQAENIDQSQNAKQADAASANEAASKKQFQDWERYGAGHQNQQAASDKKAADARQGQGNRVWKYDQEQKMADNLYHNQLAKDQAANYYNDGASYLQGGNVAAAYPAGNSYLGAYPAGANYNFGSFPSYYKY